MSHITHHAIVVTTDWDLTLLSCARREAIHLGLKVSEIVDSKCNGVQSFFVAPDGSKEGWPEFDEGNRQRKAFLRYLRGTSLRWRAVKYGELSG